MTEREGIPMKKSRPAKLKLSPETLRSPSDPDIRRVVAAENCTAVTRLASGCASG
jgi:hypothetical protein